jgi:hypothetical protein
VGRIGGKIVPNSYKQLVHLMQSFISGQDQSLELVHIIEGLLIEQFRDDADVFDELSEPIARYTLGGGEQLYDEADLAKVFKDFLSSHEG